MTLVTGALPGLVLICNRVMMGSVSQMQVNQRASRVNQVIIVQRNLKMEMHWYMVLPARKVTSVNAAGESLSRVHVVNTITNAWAKVKTIASYVQQVIFAMRAPTCIVRLTIHVRKERIVSKAPRTKRCVRQAHMGIETD